MDKDEVIVEEDTTGLIDGNITINLESGVRRTCNLTLENSDGRYTPGPNGLNYLGKKFKIYTGLILPDGSYEYNAQGVFNIGNPVTSSRFSEKVIQIEGYDNFALLNGTLGGTLDEDYYIPAGTTIEEAVKAIFTDAQIVKSPIIYPAPTPPTGYEDKYTVIYDFYTEVGGTYADMLTVLANRNAWVVYFDVDGRPRFELPVDEDSTGSSWSFLTTEVTYNGGDHNYDYLKVYNNVVVLSENVYGNIVIGQAQDTNIFSPTSIDKIGLKTLVINDSNMTDDSAAQDRAEYELRNSIQLYENIDLKCIPVDVIKEGDIVIIADTSIDIDYERYLVKQINLPITFNGLQTMKVWKTRSIAL